MRRPAVIVLTLLFVTLFAATLQAAPTAELSGPGNSQFASPARLPSKTAASPVQTNSLLGQSLSYERNSGATWSAIERRLVLLDQLSQRCARSTQLATARALFVALQDEMLYGPFDAYCPAVSETLLSGRYNCLTACILFTTLCRNHNIEATLAESTGHVRVRLELPQPDGAESRAVWVELTRPAWQPSRERLPGEVAIGDDQAMARLIYNRGTLLASRGKHAKAVRCFRDSLRLDPNDAEAADNLVATFNNWAIDQINSGELERARALVEKGLNYRRHDSDLRQTSHYLKRRGR